MQNTDAIMNTSTEKPNGPEGTSYKPFSELFFEYIVPISQGRPKPRKTFTEFEPVTFPIAASAQSASFAAVIDANVSGREVPRATKVIAVTLYLIPSAQPNKVAASLTMAVTIPIIVSATVKETHPFLYLAGGTIAKKTFQPIAAKCIAHSTPVT